MARIDEIEVINRGDMYDPKSTVSRTEFELQGGG